MTIVTFVDSDFQLCGAKIVAYTLRAYNNNCSMIIYHKEDYHPKEEYFAGLSVGFKKIGFKQTFLNWQFLTKPFIIDETNDEQVLWLDTDVIILDNIEFFSNIYPFMIRRHPKISEYIKMFPGKNQYGFKYIFDIEEKYFNYNDMVQAGVLYFNKIAKLSIDIISFWKELCWLTTTDNYLNKNIDFLDQGCLWLSVCKNKANSFLSNDDYYQSINQWDFNNSISRNHKLLGELLFALSDKNSKIIHLVGQPKHWHMMSDILEM